MAAQLGSRSGGDGGSLFRAGFLVTPAAVSCLPVSVAAGVKGLHLEVLGYVNGRFLVRLYLYL